MILCNTILQYQFFIARNTVLHYHTKMITKQNLLDHLGGTYTNVARKLGYKGFRADNNITRLPDVLTDNQVGVILMRMRARRIKVPASWTSPVNSPTNPAHTPAGG